MKTFKMIIVLFFPLLLSTIHAQTPITIGHYDTINSKVFNEKRVLMISVPSDFDKGSKEKYPVVFVLDGANHFYSLTGMIHKFSFDEGVEVTPKMIVVGVETTNRYEELVPLFDTDRLSQYLQSELIPFIDKNYHTMPYRILIGHSLAGLRVAQTAIYQPDLFNAYILIDPTLCEQENKWYDKARNDINKYQLNNKKMFVAMAQTMPSYNGQDLDYVKRDTSGESAQMRMIIEFSENMSSKNKKNEASFGWKFYPQETHASITQIAMYDGLKFVFNYYLNKTWPNVLNVDTSPKDALNIMIGYYATLSNYLGFENKPSEELFNMLNAAFTRRKQPAKAKVFAEYYLSCYPESDEAKKLVEEYKIK